MPNLNYRAGMRVEYGRRKHWIKRGFEVVRSAGSHGIWDLCGVRVEDPQHPVQFIQCKRVETTQQAKAMIKKFQKAPPLKPSPHYTMNLEIQVKGSKEVISISI